MLRALDESPSSKTILVIFCVWWMGVTEKAKSKAVLADFMM